MSAGNVVVAGGGGFIGGHLARELRDRGMTVRAADVKPLDQWHQLLDGVESVVLDLSRIEDCRVAVRGVDTVYNVAADMGGMGYIETHKTNCMLSVLINTHMLMAARDSHVNRFFFASSACVYNVAKQTATDRDLALKEADAYPAMPEDGYGWEKLFSERMCRHFAEDFGIETRVARYHNVYGPLGTYYGGREKAPAALCRKIAQAVLTGDRQIEIWGDGEQTRSFTYIDDCVEGTLRVTAGSSHDPVNVGSTEMVSINEMTSIIEGIAGIKVERRYKADAPLGVRGRNSDNTKIRETYGWEPTVRLTQGLELTYKWIFDEIASGAHRPGGAYSR